MPRRRGAVLTQPDYVLLNNDGTVMNREQAVPGTSEAEALKRSNYIYGGLSSQVDKPDEAAKLLKTLQAKLRELAPQEETDALKAKLIEFEQLKIQEKQIQQLGLSPRAPRRGLLKGLFGGGTDASASSRNGGASPKP